MVSGSMGHVHAYLKTPGLNKIAPLVEVEGSESLVDGDVANSDPQAMVRLRERIRSHLESQRTDERARVKQSLVRYTAALVDVLHQGDFRFPGPEGVDGLLERLRQATPDWLAQESGAVAALLKKHGDSIHLRDQQAATNLVQRKKTGIYFVGQLHLSALTREVQQLCQAENQSGSSRSAVGRQ